MTGQTVSHYRIVEKLGEGGMGVVYKAKDEQLGRWVAIKCLRADLVRDAGRRARFLHEARAASALNHPNIVTIYDLLRDATGDYLVMEYVEGRTLDRVIPRGGMRTGELLALAGQMADALAAAHGASIVHRDFKPGNVMVTAAGNVKVLDFGLAKLAETLPMTEREETLTAPPQSQEGVILGTICYMSPEQAGSRTVDARSDVFSFGSVLYEMVTGQRAFRGATTVETLASIIREEPKAVSELARDVPPEIERVIRRCLRKDPAKRWQTMTDLNLTLEDLRAESDSGRLAGARAMELQGPSRRWKVAAVAGAAVLAVAAIAWMSRGREPAEAVTLAPVPLTSYPGFETEPAFSPDGNQVAFSWKTDEENNFDIYVKLVGAGTPLRLTRNPAEDVGPAWSPDGKWIAFTRSAGPRFLLMVVPALGGSERRIGEFRTSPTSRHRVAWSPNGQWLAVPDCDGGTCPVTLVPFEGGEARKLTHPSAGADVAPDFSADGRFLAFHRLFSVRGQSVWVLPLAKDYSPVGEPKELTDRQTNHLPVWMPGGQGLVYTHGQTSAKLYRIPNAGGNPEHLAWAGIGASHPAVSAKGNRLAFSRRLLEVNIYSLSVGQPGQAPGPAKIFLNSTQNEYCQMFSPDGSKIAFQSNRSGNHEIWVCDSDGRNCSQLTALGEHAGSPAWSPDGQWIAFDATQGGMDGVYLIPATGGRPRRLTRDLASAVPRWSRDGKWIYFSSTGAVHRVLKEGGEMVRITQHRGSPSLESPDGKFLYYSANPGNGNTPLRRVRLEDSRDEEILPAIAGRNFVVTAKGIWFLTPVAGGNQASELKFLDLEAKTTRSVYRLEKPAHVGLDISPDGKQILFSQIDSDGADLMLVEGFR